MAARMASHRTVEVTQVDRVSESVAVRHYDELDRDAKAAFPSIVEGGDGDLPAETAAKFDDGEVVRFTDYYRVSLD